MNLKNNSIISVTSFTTKLVNIPNKVAWNIKASLFSLEDCSIILRNTMVIFHDYISPIQALQELIHKNCFHVSNWVEGIF